MKELIKVAKFAEEIYRKSTNNKICIEYAKFTRKIVKIVTIFHSTCASLIIFYVIIWFILADANHRLALPFLLPGFNLNNIKHVLITIVLHFFHVFYCMLVLCSFDVLIMVVFVNTLMISSFIKQEIVKLENALKVRNDSNREIKRFRQIVFMHREFNQ